MTPLPRPRPRPEPIDFEQEPSVLGMVVNRLNDLAEQIRHLDRKTDGRFNGLDAKLDEMGEGANKRLTALETDHEIVEVLGERKVRASDRRRHWIVTGVGVMATLAGAGVSVIVERLVS